LGGEKSDFVLKSLSFNLLGLLNVGRRIFSYIYVLAVIGFEIRKVFETPEQPGCQLFEPFRFQGWFLAPIKNA